MTAAELLGAVLERARATTGRSPEQVGEQTGIHGRTIRRLEDGESEKPRRTTLQALAGFYGLDGDVLVRLATWSSQGLGGGALRRRLTEMAEAELGADAVAALTSAEGENDEDEEQEAAIAVTMRLARPRPERFGQFGTGRTHQIPRPFDESAPALSALSQAEQDELSQLMVALSRLDRRRRRMVLAFTRELGSAQMADQLLRRRRDMAGHGAAEPLFDPLSLTGQEPLPLADPGDG
jgi:transcriptional regulator with XRE-family HTH domain